VIRAPHFTAYSALTLSDWHGWSGSLRFRTITHYTLTGDNSVTAPGYSVWDFSVAKPIRARVHGTTGYPRTIIAGVTIHLFPKQ
jgi:hypothetical protein